MTYIINKEKKRIFRSKLDSFSDQKIKLSNLKKSNKKNPFKIQINLTVRSFGTKYFFDGRSDIREFGARSTITAHRSGYSRRIRSPIFHKKTKSFYTYN